MRTTAGIEPARKSLTIATERVRHVQWKGKNLVAVWTAHAIRREMPSQSSGGIRGSTTRRSRVADGFHRIAAAAATSAVPAENSSRLSAEGSCQ
jgi:hypothetical protein